MLRSFLSKITSFFYVHPDVAAESQIELPKGKSFFDFMFRDHTGIALIVFLSGAFMSFAFGIMSDLIMFEAMGGICTWLIIRAIGLHHGNWRRAALEESMGGTYRLGYDEALRHGNIPHYARIASVVFILMTSLVIGRLGYGEYERREEIASRPLPTCSNGMVYGAMRHCVADDGDIGIQFCDPATGQVTLCTSIDDAPDAADCTSAHNCPRDAEPTSAGMHDARIGEFCITQADDVETVGIYQLQGDAVLCVDPD